MLQFSFETKHLKYRSSSLSKWKPVCFESWDNSWSDGACRQLGFAEEEFTQFNVDTDIDDSMFWFRNSSVAFKKQPIQDVKSFLMDEKCPSQAKVDLNCKTFGRLTNTNYMNLLKSLSNNRMWKLGRPRKHHLNLRKHHI